MNSLGYNSYSLLPSTFFPSLKDFFPSAHSLKQESGKKNEEKSKYVDQVKSLGKEFISYIVLYFFLFRMIFSLSSRGK